MGCQLAQFGEQLAAELESCAGLTPPQAEEVASAVYDEYILACQVATAATSLCSTLGDAAAAAAFQRSVRLLLSCGRELLAAAAARRPPFANPARKLACEMPDIQLGFMLRLLQLEPASMESAAEPDALVSWLACIVGAMRTLHAPLLDKGEQAIGWLTCGFQHGLSVEHVPCASPRSQSPRAGLLPACLPVAPTAPPTP